jgi:hypothetical protein
VSVVEHDNVDMYEISEKLRKKQSDGNIRNRYSTKWQSSQVGRAMRRLIKPLRFDSEARTAASEETTSRETRRTREKSSKQGKQERQERRAQTDG